MGVGGFRARPPTTASWNKQTDRQTDRAVSNGRAARCALDVSLHLSKCCFVCSPLNKAAVSPNQNALYLLPCIITSHSRPGLFAALTNVVDLCTNEGQTGWILAAEYQLIVYEEQHRYGWTQSVIGKPFDDCVWMDAPSAPYSNLSSD